MVPSAVGGPLAPFPQRHEGPTSAASRPAGLFIATRSAMGLQDAQPGERAMRPSAVPNSNGTGTTVHRDHPYADARNFADAPDIVNDFFSPWRTIRLQGEKHGEKRRTTEPFGGPSAPRAR
jgi:hypothetical protein